MYHEEYLPDDASLDNEYTNVENDDGTSDLDSFINEERKITKEYKRMDKHYYSLDYRLKGKTYKIESYSTPLLSNGFIRHASSGMYLEHRVGSKYSDLYFIVADGTAPPSKDYLEPRKLYYNSPEEFERHRLVRVPQPIKEAWNEKQMKARAKFC